MDVPPPPRRSGPHRKPLQRVHDRKRAVALSLGGAKQTDIANELGISQAMVSLDLATVRRQWTQEMIGDIDTVLRDELTRLDALESHSLASFMVSATENNPAGDPRFLAVAVSVARQRAKLLGMEKSAAITAQYTATFTQVNAIGNPDELRDRAMKFAAQFGLSLEQYTGLVASGAEADTIP